jgi:hypothetical protein
VPSQTPSASTVFPFLRLIYKTDKLWQRHIRDVVRHPHLQFFKDCHIWKGTELFILHLKMKWMFFCRPITSLVAHNIHPTASFGEALSPCVRPFSPIGAIQLRRPLPTRVSLGKKMAYIRRLLSIDHSQLKKKKLL